MRLPLRPTNTKARARSPTRVVGLTARPDRRRKKCRSHVGEPFERRRCGGRDRRAPSGRGRPDAPPRGRCAAAPARVVGPVAYGRPMAGTPHPARNIALIAIVVVTALVVAVVLGFGSDDSTDQA